MTDDTDVYQHIMWDVWMPHIRSAILSWDARDCDVALELIETWLPLLPTWMLDNILNQLVVILSLLISPTVFVIAKKLYYIRDIAPKRVAISASLGQHSVGFCGNVADVASR